MKKREDDYHFDPAGPGNEDMDLFDWVGVFCAIGSIFLVLALVLV